MTVFMVN